MSDETLSKLCLSCGLCCDGTLFARVPVSAQEQARLALFGIATETRADGTLALPQRCASLNGCACRAYTERPARCRQYQCNLYSAVEAGEADVRDASSVIDGAHERTRQLGVAVFGPQDDGVAVMTRIRDTAAPSAEAPAQLLELDAYLDRHFRGRR